MTMIYDKLYRKVEEALTQDILEAFETRDSDELEEYFFCIGDRAFGHIVKSIPIANFELLEIALSNIGILDVEITPNLVGKSLYPVIGDLIMAELIEDIDLEFILDQALWDIKNKYPFLKTSVECNTDGLVSGALKEELINAEEESE